MKDQLRIGIIGLGIGAHHARSYQALPQAKVAALCDLDRMRLAKAAKEFDVAETYTQAETMFARAKLDAVSICTPNKFHAPLSIAALQRGLHVLCEKPMALNVSEARSMLAAADRARRNLMINFSYRFSPMSFALKQQVDAGVIGDIYFGRTVWHRRRGLPGFGGWFGIKELSGGGPLIDLGVHRLDLALWLMGYPEPIAVSGSTFNMIAKDLARKQKKKYSVEDLACGIIKFRNGATLIIEASWASNIGENEQMITTLCGTKGGLAQKNTGGGYDFTAEVYTEERGNLFTKKFDRPTGQVPTAQAEFIDSILKKRKPMATGEDGIKVMQILDGIYQSAATGKEVIYK